MKIQIKVNGNSLLVGLGQIRIQLTPTILCSTNVVLATFYALSHLVGEHQATLLDNVHFQFVVHKWKGTSLEANFHYSENEMQIRPMGTQRRTERQAFCLLCSLDQTLSSTGMQARFTVKKLADQADSKQKWATWLKPTMFYFLFFLAQLLRQAQLCRISDANMQMVYWRLFVGSPMGYRHFALQAFVFYRQAECQAASVLLSIFYNCMLQHCKVYLVKLY